MAITQEQAGRQGVAERGIRFLRDIHIAIGAVALGGAVVLQSSLLGVIAGYEAVNATIHEGARRLVEKPKPKPQTTQLQTH